MDIRVQAILSSLWPAARRPLAPFLVLGVDILDALDLASGEEASPPAIYEPEPGVAQELDGSRWVVDVDPAHRGHFLITPSPGQEPVEGVFRRGGTVYGCRAGRGSQKGFGEKEDGSRECQHLKPCTLIPSEAGRISVGP